MQDQRIGGKVTAREACRAALAQASDSVQVIRAMGVLAAADGRYSEAISLLQRALSNDRTSTTTRGNLGVVYLLSEDYPRAIRYLTAAFGRGGAFREELRVALRNQASALSAKGNWARAARTFQRYLKIDPANSSVINDLGCLYARMGYVRRGIRYIERAVALDPANLALRSNLALIHNYLPSADPLKIRAVHQRLFGELAGNSMVYRNTPDPHRPLRVGYYCADLCLRPPAFFLPALFRAHDRNQFVIYCYSNTRHEDEFTQELRSLVDHWRPVRGMADSEIGALIRRDAIDILIDRTGHFEGGRPGLFGGRPAPVQISMPGYPCTTGVPGIGYRITDVSADPPGQTERLHTEALLRLPNSFACYAPPSYCPPVTPLPALSRGFVTFGCFQKREKITREMIDVWADVLRATPRSVLMFHQLFSVTSAAATDYATGIERRLAARGIDPGRLIWKGHRPHFEHMEALGEVDIALDTYPYNGMTTTCECLWMGVPVITWAGETHISRVGLSYLHSAGLSDWVSRSRGDYVKIASAKAADIESLAMLRGNLRRQLQESPLTDETGYTKALEIGLRTVWRNWCEHSA